MPVQTTEYHGPVIIVRQQVETAAHGRVEWDLLYGGQRISLKTRRYARYIAQATQERGMAGYLETVQDALDEDALYERRAASAAIKYFTKSA